ncbi:MAG: peptidyl-prolyl cis-trans isomerase [Henriciella sp.]
MRWYDGMHWIARFNRPFVHFISLGFLLYVLQAALFPAPKTVVGPLSQTRIEVLEARWRSESGQPLTLEQRNDLIAAELDRDLLFQRALDLNYHLSDGIVYQRLIRNMEFLGMADEGSATDLFAQALQLQLHLDDEVVKRRLIQIMKRQLVRQYPPVPPDRAQLRAEFDRRSDEFRIPPFYSIEHLYFPVGGMADMQAAISRIGEQGLEIEAARDLSAPYLQGRRFVRQTPQQLAQNFGWNFVRNLARAQPGAQQWIGPIRSSFGWHYVWVEDLEAAREARFEEVEQRLLRDLEDQAEAKALQSAILALREKYDVRGPETLSARSVAPEVG